MVARSNALRVAAAVLVCIALGFASVRASQDPLDRRIDLDLRGENLLGVQKQLAARSRMDVLIGRDVAHPSEFKRTRVYLEMRDVSVRTAADWVARALGTRYRLLDQGTALEFTSSYAWLEATPPVVRTLNLGGLVDPDDPSRFLSQVKELIKVYALRAPTYSIRMRPDGRLQAFLPPVLQDRLVAALRAMSNPGRVPVRTETSAPPGTARIQTALDRPVRVACEDRPLPEVLAVLAFQTEVNLGFDHRVLRDRSTPHLRLRLRDEPLRRALQAVAEQAGLRGSSIDPHGGIWLMADPPWWTQAGSRRLLWEDVPVIGYAVRALAEREGGEIVVRRAKRAMPTDLRTDPSVAVVYHERSGNLIVIAPSEAQETVEQVLARAKEEPAPSDEPAAADPTGD